MKKTKQKITMPAEIRRQFSCADVKPPTSRTKLTLPRTVRELVRAYVADYERRDRALHDETVDDETKQRFVFVNLQISESVECLDVCLRTVMLEDICNCTGYDKSKAHNMMCRNSYYHEKDMLEREIAYRLQIFR